MTGRVCKNGHAVAGANEYVAPGTGWSQCRACMLEATRRYRAKKAAPHACPGGCGRSCKGFAGNKKSRCASCAAKGKRK